MELSMLLCEGFGNDAVGVRYFGLYFDLMVGKGFEFVYNGRLVAQAAG
jgi:hypothetical protein